MKKKKYKKVVKMSKTERLLYTLAIALILIAPISVVFSKATLSKLNFEVEEKKRAIEEQQKENDSLAMAIDELASLTTVQQVAQSEGLSYNIANIKVVR